jgi:hypothetical protein
VDQSRSCRCSCIQLTVQPYNSSALWLCSACRCTYTTPRALQAAHTTQDRTLDAGASAAVDCGCEIISSCRKTQLASSRAPRREAGTELKGQRDRERAAFLTGPRLITTPGARRAKVKPNFGETRGGNHNVDPCFVHVAYPLSPSMVWPEEVTHEVASLISSCGEKTVTACASRLAPSSYLG